MLRQLQIKHTKAHDGSALVVIDGLPKSFDGAEFTADGLMDLAYILAGAASSSRNARHTDRIEYMSFDPLAGFGTGNAA